MSVAAPVFNNGVTRFCMGGHTQNNASTDSALLFGRPEPENWNDLVLAENPYDEKPRIYPNDTGSVGAILQVEPPKADVLYTLYLSIKDPQDEENLSRRFSALKAGIRVRK